MTAIFSYSTLALLVWMIIIILLERRFPYRKGLPIFREGFWVDLIWYTLMQSFFMKVFIFDFIIYPIDQKYQLSSLHIVSHWPSWLQVIFFLVVHDFYIYWFHRWQHSNKVLWRTHEAHHSNKEVDWLAGSRSHIVEILINQTVEFMPIILLGANPLVVPMKAFLDAVWGMYIHSNINVKAGKLQYIFNGPQMHLWHHADDKKVFHANFATKLALWDWLFGTAYFPNHKPATYGLYYDYPKDYFVQHIFSVQRVNEKKWLNNRLFNLYYHLRARLWQRFKQTVRKLVNRFSRKDAVQQPTHTQQTI